MFGSSELRDELQTVKDDAARLPNATSKGIFDVPKSCGNALADQVKTAPIDLSDTLSEQEDRVAHVISDRPIASLAAALALGTIVGFMLGTLSGLVER